MHWQLQDTHWQSTEDFAVTEKLLLILSVVLFSDVAQNLLRNIFIRESVLFVSGRIQTGSYTNKDGVRVYTTEVVVEEQEFAESKNSSGSDGGYTGGGNRAPEPSGAGDGFMNIPDGIDEELPFN